MFHMANARAKMVSAIKIEVKAVNAKHLMEIGGIGMCQIEILLYETKGNRRDHQYIAKATKSSYTYHCRLI